MSDQLLRVLIQVTEPALKQATDYAEQFVDLLVTSKPLVAVGSCDRSPAKST